MPSTTLPNEVVIIVFESALNSYVAPEHDLTFIDTYSRSRPLPYQERLDLFRRLALVCKVWSNLARNVFWSDIEVPSLKLQHLAKAIVSPEAKPSCIRRFTIFDSGYTNTSIRRAVKFFSQCLPIILRHLPRMLQTFNIRRQSSVVSGPLWRIVKDTVEEGLDWTSAVKSMIITGFPTETSVLPFTFHFRNITRLRISLEQNHREYAHLAPFDHLCLDSLTVDIIFRVSQGPDGDLQFVSAAKCLGDALKAACTSLKSLCINMCHWCSQDERLYIDVFQHLHPLGSATVSELTLQVACDKDDHVDPMPMRAIERAEALARLPALQTLVLHEFGITPAGLAQMGDFQLKHLQVVVMGITSLDGSETMGEMIKCLTLPQLAKVESIDIGFGEFADFGFPLEDQPWRGTRVAWADFERACADRAIQCRMIHP